MKRKNLLLVGLCISLLNFSIAQNSQSCTTLDENGLTILTSPNWITSPGIIHYSDCPTHKVGIGWPVPRTKLEVNGKTYSRSLMLGSDFSNSDYSSNANIFHLKADNLNASTLFLLENSQQRLFQIENNGLVRAREIRVDIANNWPDYVFQENYPLMSLDLLKTYIDEKKHLPGVPSAAEIKLEGIPLGEMNAILLEKIEELTLYMLKQEEKILELQKLVKNN